MFFQSLLQWIIYENFAIAITYYHLCHELENP